MSEVRQSVLIVDDDETFRRRLARALEARGYDAVQADNAEQALALARSDSPEYAIVDLRMPGASGLEAVTCLKAIDPTTKVLVLTGFGSIATAVDAVQRGAVNYLTKPADVDEILGALDHRAPSSAGKDEFEGVPSLARAEWEHIQRVMAHCGGNVSRAARLLGIHRRSLQRKLAKYPVSR